MGRIFSLIAGLAALMVVLAGSGSYGFSASKIDHSNSLATTATAQALIAGIDSHIQLLQQAVDGLAASDSVKQAFSAERVRRNLIAAELKPFIPGALQIRLLPPTLTEPDQSTQPQMGFGDLEMVRSTLTAPQKPVIQGDGDNRHLAITSRVELDHQTIGVVLVSFSPDLVKQALSKYPLSSGYAEIRQDQVVIATTGNAASKSAEPNTLQLPNSRWSIDVWPEASDALLDAALLFAIIALPALLAALVFFIGYRKLATALLQDQSTILKAAKDMMTGKKVGNYPINLNEMRPIISTLAQFKRVLDHDPNAAQEDNADDALADFFDESFDFSILDDSERSTPTAPLDFESISMPLNIESLTAQTPSPKALPPTASAFEALFKAYDIRGIVGQGLDVETINQIGRAIASQAREQGVFSLVLGRDGRLSSPDLAPALARGLTLGGCNVVDIGLVPTPVLYFAAHHNDGRSGVMLTGSHNPADYNGLKIVLNGETLSGERIQALKQRIIDQRFYSGQPGNIEHNRTVSQQYTDAVCQDIRLSRPLTVVIDAGNGAAGPLAKALFTALGCQVIALYCDIDGHFPNHHPDPSQPDNLRDVIAAVKRHQAAIGLAFDGDGDRLGVVDSQGTIIWPDRQLMLFASEVLATKPGATVLFDVKCSQHLARHIQSLGGQALMWKTGHSLLKAKLKETGAALAGEMSGHIFFNDRWFGFDDALYAAARLLAIVAADSGSSAARFASLPNSLCTPEINVAMAEGQAARFVEQLCQLAQFPDANCITLDGLRVEFSDGWGLVRASNTTPSLVMRFEADNPAAMTRIQQQFKALMRQLEPNLSLPF